MSSMKQQAHGWGKIEPSSKWSTAQDVLQRDGLMPILASVVSRPIPKLILASIIFFVSYCCTIDVV